MQEEFWVLCPNCRNKTRIKVLEETILQRFPLFCPKCKREFLIDVENGEIIFSQQRNTANKEIQISQDAETQS